MIFASLILTMSTCLSVGCNDIARSISMESLEEKTNTIIDSFNGLYDLNEFELSKDKELSLLKANIMNYIGQYNLLQSDYYCELEKIVTFDPNYSQVISYQSSLKRSELPLKIQALYAANLHMDYDEVGLLNLGERHNILPGVDDIPSNNPILPSIITFGINKDLIFNKDIGCGGGGGGNTSQDTLPIRTYNENSVSVHLNGSLEGNNFLGLICTPDACKTVYNFIAQRINAYATKPKDSQLYSVAKNLINLIFAYNTPIQAYNAIRESKLFGQIVKCFGDLVAAFKTTILGKIIAILCVFVLTCVAVTLIAMFICGFFEVGFAVGWIIRNIFNREWVATILK